MITEERLLEIKNLLIYYDSLPSWVNNEQTKLLDISLEVEDYINSNEECVSRQDVYKKEIDNFLNHMDKESMYKHGSWIKYLYFFLFGTMINERFKEL